jgi:tetratricopeptide (TPR) repeat protein
LGDSLNSLGDFQRAVVAYEYALFVGLGSTEPNPVFLKSAQCLKQIGKYSQAMSQLDRADLYNERDSMRFFLFYEYALNALLDNKPDIALSKMLEARHEFTDTSTFYLLLPLEILALNEMQQWKEAHIKYLQFAKSNSITVDPYAEILSFKMKSADKATALSYWLPGAGQMYAGYIWKGFVSSMLNIGLMGFSAWSFLNGYFYSGAFTGIALFYLSYNGGTRYAGELANQYNKRKVDTFNAKVKKLIIDQSVK